MSRLGKKSVELNAEARPSRIRRDPVRTEKPETVVGKIDFSSREWEIGLAILGMVSFAVALDVIWIGLSAWLSQ